jgi:hypothetical protein
MSNSAINVAKLDAWFEMVKANPINLVSAINERNGQLSKSAVADAADFSREALKPKNGSKRLVDRFNEIQTELIDQILLHLNKNGGAAGNSNIEGNKIAKAITNAGDLNTKIRELESEITQQNKKIDKIVKNSTV